MSEINNQKIKCDVESCKYNDCGKKLCCLDKINVSCTCDCDSCNSKIETICDSFEEK